MIKKSKRMAYLLVFLFLPVHAHGFDTDLDGRVVIDWMDFRKTLEIYQSNIKLRGNLDQAAEAEKKGKAYFLEGRYEDAYFLGYQDAMSYVPRPEYFFITGDIKLRTMLSFHSDSPHAPPEYKACWGKYKFAMDVNRDLESPFQTGFGLVEELNLSEIRDSKIYKQAMTSASCFARLTNKYLENMELQCVPIAEVKACLGSPLLLLYH